MIYKTTYFKIPINNQISIDKDVFSNLENLEKLENEIRKLSEEMEELLFSIESSAITQFKGNILCSSSDFLNKLKKIIWTRLRDIKYRKKQEEYANEYGELSRFYEQAKFESLLYKKSIYEERNNRRFTEKDNENLEQHINEIASQGWELFSLTPIVKGVSETFHEYSDSSVGSYGYGGGYGHAVQEGFVLVWKKNN